MKIGRNDKCPCGSGKKFKNCHLGKEGCVTVQKPTPPAPMPDLEELNPAKADVMSSAYWDKMSKRLPPGMRKEFEPIIAEMKQHIEIESHRKQIDDALQVLEAHRDEYSKLLKDTPELFRRSELLFGEEPFAEMRFSSADVHRAFDNAGYFPVSYNDKRFVEVATKSISFLLDDARRKTLTQRLLLTLPDYVTAGRFLDGWIIQHSADLIMDPQKNMVGPFLLVMFMHGFKEWEKQREQEQAADAVDQMPSDGSVYRNLSIVI